MRTKRIAMRTITPNMENVPWERDTDSEQILKEAISIAREVVRLEVQPRLKKAILHTLVWNVTVSGGKYETRYYSKAALREGTERIHEHVFQRAYLVKRILNKPERLSDYFKYAVSCVVTTDEDTALTKEGRGKVGWARYIAAGIVVIDRATGEGADLIELQESALSDLES